MTRNFSITGAAALLAIAACGETTEENVTFAFSSVGDNFRLDTRYAPARAEIPGVRVEVQRIFSSPGTRRYHCTIHQGLKGSIIV